MKKCSDCGITKPLDDFYLERRTQDRRQGICKLCSRIRAKEWNRAHRDVMNARNREYRTLHHDELNARRRERRAADPDGWRAKKRAWHRKSLYGLSVAQVETMLAEQAGKCAVCGSDISVAGTDGAGGRTRICIDHDHKTGEVRGLLCPACNVGIGGLKDDPALLRAAIDYLARFAAPTT